MKRILIFAAAFVAIVGAPAMAVLGPLPVVDVQALPNWVRHLANDVTMINQGMAQVTAAQTELKALATTPNLANVQGEVNAISASGRQLATEVRGTFAASQVVADSSYDAAEQARLNGLAQTANGANQQAQITNAQLSRTNNLLLQGNVLSAQAQIQHAAEQAALGQAWAQAGQMAGGAADVKVANDL